MVRTITREERDSVRWVKLPDFWQIVQLSRLESDLANCPPESPATPAGYKQQLASAVTTNVRRVW